MDPENEIINSNAGLDAHQLQDNQPSDGAGQSGDQPEAQPGAAAAAFLDTLMDGDVSTDDGDGQGEPAPAGAGERARDEHGRFLPRAGDPVQTAQQLGAGQPSAAASGAQPGQQPPVDEQARQAQEDAELLAGIKSERGRERVQRLIAERNETRAQAEQVQQSLQGIQQVLQDAGMDANQFAQQIEFARLINSSDPANLGVAVQMIEQVRADLYKRLGRDAPGVDVLADFPDLAQRVNNFEIDRAAALEIAQHRRNQQQMEHRQQLQQQAELDNQQFQQSLQRGLGDAQSYLQSRSNEVDHPARMAVLQQYFSNPANQQEFARTYRPEQMAHAIRFMYDNIRVAPQTPAPAPLSGRPSPLGRPAPEANANPINRMASHLEQMGIG